MRTGKSVVWVSVSGPSGANDLGLHYAAAAWHSMLVPNVSGSTMSFPGSAFYKTQRREKLPLTHYFVEAHRWQYLRTSVSPLSFIGHNQATLQRRHGKQG